MRALFKQGAWYLFAGVSAALIEFGLFSLLNQVARLDIAASNVLATVVATTCNFAVNRKLTFKSASDPRRSAVLYALLFLVNMAVSTLAIMELVRCGVPSPAAKAAMQVCVVAWNFVIYKKIVFR